LIAFDGIRWSKEGRRRTWEYKKIALQTELMLEKMSSA